MGRSNTSARLFPCFVSLLSMHTPYLQCITNRGTPGDSAAQVEIANLAGPRIQAPAPGPGELDSRLPPPGPPGRKFPDLERWKSRLSGRTLGVGSTFHGE